MMIIRVSGQLKIIKEILINLENFHLLKRNNQLFYREKMNKIKTTYIIFIANTIASLRNRFISLKKLGIKNGKS